MGSAFKKVKDIEFGKDDKGISDKFLELDPSLGRVTESGRSGQESALGKFKEMLGRDTDQEAINQVAAQENQLRAAADDQEMQAKQMVAQRGLGNSSLGMNAILGQKAKLGNQIGAVRSSLPALQNQLAQQNLQFSTGGINSILNTRGAERAFVQGREGMGRQGGMLAGGLGLVGGFFGGSGGAQGGQAMGKSAGNAF